MGKEAFLKRGLLNVKSPIVDRKIADLDSLEKIWHNCLFEKLKVDPSSNSVLLTKNFGFSDKNLQKTAEYFFEFFDIPSLYMPQ